MDTKIIVSQSAVQHAIDLLSKGCYVQAIGALETIQEESPLFQNEEQKLKEKGFIWWSPIIKEEGTCDCRIVATNEATYLYNLEDGGLHYGHYLEKDKEQLIIAAKSRYAERLLQVIVNKNL